MTLFNLNDPTTPIAQEYFFDISNYTFGAITRLEVSSSLLIWGFNMSSLVINYACFACIVRGDYANLSSIPVSFIFTNQMANTYTFFVQGLSSAGDRTLWVNINNKVDRYKILSNNSAVPLTGINATHVEMYSYNDNAVLFNEDYTYSLRNYEQTGNNTQATFGINVTFHEWTALNSDTTLLSIYDVNVASNLQEVTQYQIVGDCNSYKANTSNNNICICY